MPVKNVCDCHNPPGGSIVCEPHQMAICGVIDGVVRRECLDPPSGGTPIELVSWALNQIAGEARPAEAPITAEDLHILTDGTYQNPDGTIVNFLVPENVIMAITSVVTSLKKIDDGAAEV